MPQLKSPMPHPFPVIREWLPASCNPVQAIPARSACSAFRPPPSALEKPPCAKGSGHAWLAPGGRQPVSAPAPVDPVRPRRWPGRPRGGPGHPRRGKRAKFDSFGLPRGWKGRCLEGETGILQIGTNYGSRLRAFIHRHNPVAAGVHVSPRNLRAGKSGAANSTSSRLAPPAARSCSVLPRFALCPAPNG